MHTTADKILRNGCSVMVLNPGPSSYYVKAGLVAERAPCSLSVGLTNEDYLDTISFKNLQDMFSRILESGSDKLVGSFLLWPAVRNIFRIDQFLEW